MSKNKKLPSVSSHVCGRKKFLLSFYFTRKKQMNKQSGEQTHWRFHDKRERKTMEYSRTVSVPLVGANLSLESSLPQFSEGLKKKSTTSKMYTNVLKFKIRNARIKIMFYTWVVNETQKVHWTMKSDEPLVESGDIEDLGRDHEVLSSIVQKQVLFCFAVKTSGVGLILTRWFSESIPRFPFDILLGVPHLVLIIN